MDGIKTRTDKRMYIGLVLDIYKKGSSGRHGSIETADSISGLSYLSLEVYLPRQTVCSLSFFLITGLTPPKGDSDSDADDEPSLSCQTGW